MARILTQTLFRNRNLPLKSPLFSAWASHRQFTSEAQLIEIDLDPTSSTSRSSSSSLSDGEFEALALKRLDDLIHGIIVQKSTPDWLPFVPGSSFWVPPRPGTSKVLDLVGKLADQLNPEQSLSLSTSRGWPCSSFFNNNHGNESAVDLEGNGSAEGEMEGEVEVKVSDDTSQSKDEEG
ncbi:hypothetical protein FCV25MIE_30494 [Fagus crenata]